MHEDDWIDAHEYPGAQVALLDYAPTGWPPGTRTIARRVRYAAEQLSADPRSRRSRTVGKDQLALVLDGIADRAIRTYDGSQNNPLKLNSALPPCRCPPHRDKEERHSG